MLSAKVNRLLVLLRMVLLVTLVSCRLWLNRNWAANHSRKHCMHREARQQRQTAGMSCVAKQHSFDLVRLYSWQ